MWEKRAPEYCPQKEKKKLSCLQVIFLVDVRGQTLQTGRKPQQGNGNSKKCDAREQEKLLVVVSSYLFHADSDAADGAVGTVPREWRPRGPTPGGRNNLWRQSLEEALKASWGGGGGGFPEGPRR